MFGSKPRCVPTPIVRSGLKRNLPSSTWLSDGDKYEEKNREKVSKAEKVLLEIEKKRRMCVDELLDVNDDNSVVLINEADRENLGLITGGIVKLYGRKNSSTFCIINVHESCDRGKILMNRCARDNLRVRLSDIVIIKPIELLPYAKKIRIQLIEEEERNLTTNLDRIMRTSIIPYFSEKYRPVHHGDIFKLKNGIEFRVLETVPVEGGKVISIESESDQRTEICCEKRSMGRYDNVLCEKIGLDDIGGHRKLIFEIMTFLDVPMNKPLILDGLSYPRLEKGRLPSPSSRISHPRSFIFHGPDGIGKGTTAQAIANETSSSFFRLDQEVAQTYENPEREDEKTDEEEGEEDSSPAREYNVDDVFIQKVVQNSPSIVYIPNIDEIYDSKLRYFIRRLLSKSEDAKNVFIIASTSQSYETLSSEPYSKLFDRVFSFSMPDEVGRLEILRIHTKNLMLNDGVDFEIIAKETHGFVGSDLFEVCQSTIFHCLKKLKYHHVFSKSILESTTENLRDIHDLSPEMFELLNSIEITQECFDDALRYFVPRNLRPFTRFLTNNELLPQKCYKGLTRRNHGKCFGDLGYTPRKHKFLEESLLFMKEFVEYPHLFEKFGQRMSSRGILVYGPEGCGKTHLVSSIGYHIGVYTLRVSKMDYFSADAACDLKKLFDVAKLCEPIILFLDDLDVVFSDGGDTKRIGRLIIEEIDRVLRDTNARVFVIGATSRPELLDREILRSGRLDQFVHVGKPDEDERREVLLARAQKTPIDEKTVDLEELVKKHTVGYTCGDLVSLMGTAAEFAVKENIRELMKKKEERKKMREERRKKRLEEGEEEEDIITSSDLDSDLDEEEEDLVPKITMVHFGLALGEMERKKKEMEMFFLK